MLAVDRITERGKKAIIDILAKSIEIEYAFILNYPRLIDQLVNIEPIAQERAAQKLELLGKESVQVLFQQARHVAEQNQASGILAAIRTIDIWSRDMVKERSRTIHILERLEIDEGRHIKLVENIMAELGLPMQQ